MIYLVTSVRAISDPSAFPINLHNSFEIFVGTAKPDALRLPLFLFLRTRKTLKKLEKDFIKETQNLSQQQFEDLKKQRIVKEILVSHSRT